MTPAPRPRHRRADTAAHTTPDAGWRPPVGRPPPGRSSRRARTGFRHATVVLWFAAGFAIGLAPIGFAPTGLAVIGLVVAPDEVMSTTVAAGAFDRIDSIPFMHADIES